MILLAVAPKKIEAARDWQTLLPDHLRTFLIASARPNNQKPSPQNVAHAADRHLDAAVTMKPLDKNKRSLACCSVPSPEA